MRLSTPDARAFAKGDIVELIECDQWPQHVGKRGVVLFSPTDPADPNIQVEFDDPEFPGYVTRKEHWKLVE